MRITSHDRRLEGETRMAWYQQGSHGASMRPNEGGSVGRETAGKAPEKKNEWKIPDAVRELFQQKDTKGVNNATQSAIAKYTGIAKEKLGLLGKQSDVTPKDVRENAGKSAPQSTQTVTEYSQKATEAADANNKRADAVAQSTLELTGVDMVFSEDKASQSDPTAPRFKTKALPETAPRAAPAVAAQSAPQKEKSAPAPQVAAAETLKKENPQEPEDPTKKEQKKVA